VSVVPAAWSSKALARHADRRTRAMATSSGTAASRRTCTSSSTRWSSRSPSVAARSRIVRAGVVTGMPSRVVTSSSRSVPLRWICSPGREREPVRGTVMCTTTGSTVRSSQSAAADAWLSAAAGPPASAAAIQRPRSLSAVCPTPYTPVCSRCSVPARSRRAMPLSVSPSSRSCARETTPCCRPASSGINLSRIATTIDPALARGRRSQRTRHGETATLCRLTPPGARRPRAGAPAPGGARRTARSRARRPARSRSTRARRAGRRPSGGPPCSATC
jgi:hypothetical protein